MASQLDDTGSGAGSAARRLRGGTDWPPVDPYDPDDPHLWIKVEHLGRYLFAAQLLGQEGAGTVVDIGCGTGYGLVELAAAVPRVVGLDADVTAAAELAAGNAAIETHQLDVARVGGSGVGRAGHAMPAPTAVTDGPRNVETGQVGAGDRQQMPPDAPDRRGNVGTGGDDDHGAQPMGWSDLPADLVTAADAVCCFEVLEHVEAPDALARVCARLLRPGGLLVASVPDAAAEAVDTAGLPTNRSHRRAFTYDDLVETLDGAGFEVLYRLGQGIIGRIIRRETQLRRGPWIGAPSSDIGALHQRDAVRYLAATLGMPTPSDLGGSYSITVIARLRSGG